MGEVIYGGPYAYEVDAIRDERVKASREEREPDFTTLFNGVTVSQGALNVIADIENPPAPFDGNYVNNVEPVVESDANAS